MSIDTAEKRANVAWLIPTGPPTVTPNASADIEWRQQAGWGYGGIAASEAVFIYPAPALAVTYRTQTAAVTYGPTTGKVNA